MDHAASWSRITVEQIKKHAVCHVASTSVCPSFSTPVCVHVSRSTRQVSVPLVSDPFVCPSAGDLRQALRLQRYCSFAGQRSCPSRRAHCGGGQEQQLWKLARAACYPRVYRGIARSKPRRRLVPQMISCEHSFDSQ